MVIAGHRNAPANLVFWSGDADVFQTAVEETKNFIAFSGRHNQKLVGFNRFQNGSRVVAEPEKVVFFFDFFVGSVVVRADAVISFDVGFAEKLFVAGAVPADVL